MKKFFTLIFGMTILGLTSFSADAAPYDYDDSYDYDRSYGDYGQNYDSRGAYDYGSGNYNSYGSYNRYDQNYNSRGAYDYDSRNYNFHGSYNDYNRNYNSRGVYDYDSRNSGGNFGTSRGIRGQEDLRKMQEIEKQFEMFMKTQGQNNGGVPLSAEQQKERKLQQMRLINMLQERIQSEDLRRQKEGTRQQEKIDRISPQRWSDEKKVRSLDEQLVETEERLKNFIRDLQDYSISDDVNLEFIAKSFEFNNDGINNLLYNGSQVQK